MRTTPRFSGGIAGAPVLAGVGRRRPPRYALVSSTARTTSAMAVLLLVGHAKPAPEPAIGDMQGIDSFSTEDLLPSFCGFAADTRAIASVAKRCPALPRTDAPELGRRSAREVRDIHRGRVNRRTDVLLHPVRRAPRGLVRARRVLAYPHCRAAGVRTKGRIANKARHPGDDSLDVLLPLLEDVEQLRCTLPGIAANYCVHRAPPFRGYATLIASRTR
jgi:hypothetical protein